MNEGKLLLTVNEVADRLSISQSALRRLIKGCQIKHVMIGRSVRIPRDEVVRFIGERYSPEEQA